MKRSTKWIIVAGAGLLLATGVLARETTLSLSSGLNLSQGPVTVVSDSLVANHTEAWVEFTGSVVATQQDSTVTADHMKIWYQTGQDQAAAGPGPTEAVSRIRATGHVTIENPRLTATAEAATYTGATESLLLTGDPAVLKSGANEVTGARVTLERDGRLTVTGGQAGRVKAVFYPEEASTKDQDAGADTQARGEN